MMLMTTYKEAWQEVVTQLIPLRTALSTSDWKGLLTDNGMINLRDWVSFGRLVDEGRLPFDLLLTAMSMASVWVEDFLRNQHESGGIWRYRGLRAQLIRVTHGTSSRVNVHPLSRAYLTYSSVHKRVFPHLRIHDILKPKKRT